MSLAVIFHYLMLNMFRMLIHPYSGACDLFVELFHGLKQCFSLHPDTTPSQPNHNVTPTHINQNNTTHEITHQISRKLLRMDVLTSETCWALNNEIKKQVTSSWPLFIQLDKSSLIIHQCTSHTLLCQFHKSSFPAELSNNQGVQIFSLAT